MKNLYIHGSFMNDNYGDFLLYYVVEQDVEKYKNINWYSADVDASYDKYCKVNRKNKKEAIESADLVIFAGGGYFGEPAKRRLLWNLRCLVKHTLPAYKVYKRKIPYIIVGIEAGPISFPPNRILLKKIFNGAEKVSVRNDESKTFLEKIHVKNKIEVNPDWIMGVKENDFPIKNIDVRSLLQKNKQEKIIFLHLTTKNNNSGMNNVVADLKKFQSNRNVIYIIGCDQNRDIQKERAKTLFDELDNPNNRLCFYQGPWYLSKVLKNVDAVVTDKLHVGIVSTKYNKEVISVASHPKSVKFYKLIGRERWTSLLSTIKPRETYRKLSALDFQPISLDNSILKAAKKKQTYFRRFSEGTPAIATVTARSLA